MPSRTLTPAMAGQSDMALVQLGDVPWETYVALFSARDGRRVDGCPIRGRATAVVKRFRAFVQNQP
jgi:hypothetical protein